jgi:hypothetical protein
MKGPGVKEREAVKASDRKNDSGNKVTGNKNRVELGYNVTQGIFSVVIIECCYRRGV